MLFKRYALAWCVITYMAGILLLHALGLFPRAGIYDLSRLIGASQVTIEGCVQDSPTIRWSQTRFLIKGSARPLQAFRGLALVTLSYPDWDLAPGDRIRVRGWLSATRPPSRTRDFDERSYWASRGVFSLLKVWSADSVTVVRRSSPWGLGRASWTFHQRYADFWERVLPQDEADLLLGVTMGARGVLPAELKDACIRAGVYHIVVVSGQNMSLIVGLGVSLLLFLRVPRRHALWICAAPVIFYAAAVGGDPPVVRAAVMALVGLLTAALARDVPRYYSLLLAAGWILLWDPAALLGASFQLSFGATFSLLVLLPYWDSPFMTRGRWRRWLFHAAIMGLSVHVGIWPLLIYYFHRLSLAGFIANWTVFPLAGLLMILGLVLGTLGVAAPRAVPAVMITLVGWLVRGTLALIWRMSGWPWAVHAFKPLPGAACVLYYGFLFGILFMFYRRKPYAQTLLPFKASRARLQRG